MEDPDYKPIYLEGFNAALAHASIDRCRYRLPEKRAAWIRGFRDGELKAQINQLDQNQKESALGNIAKMKSALKQQED